MNEKGFTFPMVLIIATSIILLLGFTIDQFISEKRFYKEVEESLIADHLLRLAVKDLERKWNRTEDVIIENGMVFYPKGDVYYEVTFQNEEQAMIHFYSSTQNERKAITSIRYDKSLQKVVSWVEN